ncbi:FecR domain-containing protein [Dokdonella sp.]|uniref:FecR domain-containing protein n=1 Tax=Dokdonella sp. TaxID=2291710 RepID=UPI00262C986E|nr:FecR domain-containing protein [Dokdonella sp.]
MLSGTALRNLKPKSKLWVVAGNTWVRAVGTAFNVYRREDGVRVTVSEGAVKVAASRQDVPSDEALARLPVLLLAAGEQVGVRPTGPAKQVLSPPAVEREVARRTGTPHFQDQPFAASSIRSGV